ncbi:MAG: response regulator [Methylobacter sp.]|nr:response regulator [Methylobacter sp.]
MIDGIKPLILVADDNTIGRYTTTRILKYAGFEVMEAVSGEETLELAQQNPDLILLDVNLPDMNGFEVCQELKSHLQTREIPVIHLTAQEIRSESVVKGLEGGADAYLVQPITPKELIAWIKTSLRIRNAKFSADKIQDAQNASDDMYAHTRDLLCILDQSRCFWRLSNSWKITLGYSLTQLLGRPFLELVHPEDSPATKLVLDKLKEENITIDHINRCLHQNGAYRLIKWRYYSAHLLIYATAHDITQGMEPDPAL